MENRKSVKKMVTNDDSCIIQIGQSLADISSKTKYIYKLKS